MAPEPPRATDPYAMSGQERSKYESIFPMYDSDRDGFVTGVEAVELFSKSRLPREVRVLMSLGEPSPPDSNFVLLYINSIFVE